MGGAKSIFYDVEKEGRLIRSDTVARYDGF